MNQKMLKKFLVGLLAFNIFTTGAFSAHENDSKITYAQEKQSFAFVISDQSGPIMTKDFTFEVLDEKGGKTEVKSMMSMLNLKLSKGKYTVRLKDNEYTMKDVSFTVTDDGIANYDSIVNFMLTKKKAEELESKKKAAENEKTSLADQLKKLTGEMEETKKKISAKEDEITNKEEELILAKADENEQYESMKKRIRYMYENGNTGFVEILCSSKSIGELLNNAEYISRISGYDRNMLVEFQKVVTNVENQEAELKKEYKELQTMQDNLITKQDSVNELIKNKQSEIQSLTSELGDTKNKLAQLEAAAAEAERKQKEAAAAAAAAKKAQAAAKKNTSSSGSSAGSAGASVVSGNGTFTHPCPGGYISSGFGYRTQPIAGASTNHKGIDFAAATGTPIYAAAAGTVISAGYAGNAGNLLVISHGNGLLTYYMHCNAIYVSAGQKVSRGQNVAAVGTTGNSTGPHLHFQVMLNGTPVNPANYL